MADLWAASTISGIVILIGHQIVRGKAPEKSSAGSGGYGEVVLDTNVGFMVIGLDAGIPIAASTL